MDMKARLIFVYSSFKFFNVANHVLHISGACMYVVRLATKEQNSKLLKHH